MELKVFFKSRFAGYASGTLRPRPAVCLIKRLSSHRNNRMLIAAKRWEIASISPQHQHFDDGRRELNMERKEKVEGKEMNHREQERWLWLIKPPTLIRLLTWVSACPDQTWIPQGAQTEQAGWKRMNINACLTPSLLTNGPCICSSQTGLLTRQEICTPLMLIKILHAECAVNSVQGGKRWQSWRNRSFHMLP